MSPPTRATFVPFENGGVSRRAVLLTGVMTAVALVLANHSAGGRSKLGVGRDAYGALIPTVGVELERVQCERFTVCIGAGPVPSVSS